MHPARTFFGIVGLSALLLTTAPAAQATETYSLDHTHTNIMWFASHFGFSDSMGQFMDFEGTVVLDNDEPANSHVEVTIQTDSIMTGLPKFDDHLKSGDFFNVAEFPTATFKSSQVTVTGDNSASVEGDLTMLGVTKPITLDVTLNKQGTNPFNQKQTAGFTATTVIKRSEFGMNYGIPGISDEVKLHIEAEGVAGDD